jgi:hypothetical protein
MNNTERLLYQKHHLSDEERNQILKLINCALSTREIASIMHISTSTVSYVRQAHTACIDKDWNTLQRLSTGPARATTEWAMKITGTDKVFKETFGEPKKIEKEPEQVAPATAPVVETISKEDFQSLSATLQYICYLLTEIRDLIK